MPAVVNEFLSGGSRAPSDRPALAAWRRAAPALALVALLAWCAAVARGGFAFDDREAIDGNPVVSGGLPVLAAFARDYWHHRGDAGHYRPLAALSLRADRALWRAGRSDDPSAGSRGFHATNVALHVGVVVLAAGALASVLAPRGARADAYAGARADAYPGARADAHTGARTGARVVFAGVLPLAAHPVLADSVAWISGRTSMISALGGTGAILVASACAPAVVAGCGGLALLAGMLGKEDAVVFAPAVLLVAAGRSRRHAAYALAGIVAAVAAACGLRRFALAELVPSSPSAALAGLDLLERLRYAGRALCEVARLSAWPFDAPPNYRGADGFSRGAPPGAWAWLGWVAWLGALASGARALVSRKARGRAGRIALGLAALALLPVLQIVPAGEVFAPRFLYLPLLLAAPALAATLGRLPRGVLALLAAALVAGAWVQSGRYASRTAYARATLAHAPADALSLNDLGLGLEEEGNLAEAVEAYGRATLDPTYGRPWSNLGRIAMERGAIDEAIELLERAVERGPSQPIARVNLASARLRAGDAAGAAADYAKATALAPGLAPAWRGLGQALLGLDRDAEARAALEVALELDPSDAAARALLRQAR